MPSPDILALSKMLGPDGQPRDEAIENMALLCGWHRFEGRYIKAFTQDVHDISDLRTHLLDPTSVVARERAVMVAALYFTESVSYKRGKSTLSVYEIVNAGCGNVLVERFVSRNEWWNRRCAVKWMEAA
jgi:hypothetical protein